MVIELRKSTYRGRDAPDLAWAQHLGAIYPFLAPGSYVTTGALTLADNYFSVVNTLCTTPLIISRRKKDITQGITEFIPHSTIYLHTQVRFLQLRQANQLATKFIMPLIHSLLHATNFSNPFLRTLVPSVTAAFGIQAAVAIPSIALQSERFYDVSGRSQRELG